MPAIARMMIHTVSVTPHNDSEETSVAKVVDLGSVVLVGGANDGVLLGFDNVVVDLLLVVVKVLIVLIRVEVLTVGVVVLTVLLRVEVLTVGVVVLTLLL